MECSCGGAIIEGKSCYRNSSDYFCLIIEDIPAFQCTRCGKVLFKDEIVERIQKMIRRIEVETNEIATGNTSVNLYDYK